VKPHRRMDESGPHPTIEWSNRLYELWHPPSQGRIARVYPPAGGSNCDLTIPTAGWSNALSASPVYRDRLSRPGGNPPSNGQIYLTSTAVHCVSIGPDRLIEWWSDPAAG
jgi:hypothetical protein